MKIIGNILFYAFIMLIITHPFGAFVIGGALYGILRLVGFFDAPKATEYRR